MRRIPSQLLAVTSAAILLTTAHGRTRPRYGDTLRVETHAIAMSGDNTPDLLVGLVFETLVTVDDKGELQPAIATSWTTSNGGRRWDFTLRAGVLFHDGQICDLSRLQQFFSGQPGIPARVRATGDRLIFESDSPQLNLPALLSLPRYAISEITTDGAAAVGTGPFRLDHRSGPVFSLVANDHYWGGRPYLDSIELMTSRDLRDQMNDFLLDRAAVVEVAPEQLRRAQQDRLRLSISRPSETIFLLADPSRSGLNDARLRQAIALAIDRAAIHNVIFQHQGDVAYGLLPNWITGYEFLFSSTTDLTLARQLLAGLRSPVTITVGYDPRDTTGRLIAERIALNTRDIGLPMQSVAGGGDIRLRHIELSSANAMAALNNVFDQLGIAVPATSQSTYQSEHEALATYLGIPLVHLPRITALKDPLRDWKASPDGRWHFGDVWLTRPATESAP